MAFFIRLTEQDNKKSDKYTQRIWFSALFLLMAICFCSVYCSAGSLDVHRVRYGTCLKIVPKHNEIKINEKTRIRVTTKNSSSEHLITVTSVTYKNLTPALAKVTKKGKVTGKKSGTAKIKVTVNYKVVDEVQTKCVGNENVGLHYWITTYQKETRTINIKIRKKFSATISQAKDIPIVGGSVLLSFECDGTSYGNTISIGVGIRPDVDYKNLFPSDPVKEGYRFDGWVTKNGTKIGTKAGEIYPAFNTVQSGQSAVVFASFVKLSKN